MGDKAQATQMAPAGLFQDIREVLRLFGDFTLKIGLNAHLTFQVHLLSIPIVQEFKSYTRL